MKIKALWLCLGLMVGILNAQVKIDALKFGSGVENNEVTGESTSFPSNVGKVYCWMKVVGGEGQTLTVKWYNNGNALDEVALDIKSYSMRTYAYKSIYRSGTWKAEIVDASGKVLTSGEFTVAEGAMSSAGDASVTTSASTAAPVSSQADGETTIGELKFGTGVENREISGESASFDAAGTEAVYCWIAVMNAGDGKTVTMKWYRDGQLLGDVPLEAKGYRTRTWAYRGVKGITGSWKVEVVGPSGVVMKSASFTTN